jgi:hypothetical protein
MKLFVVTLGLTVTLACSSSQPVATPQETPSPTAAATSPSPSPAAAVSDDGAPVGTPVAQQTLPPATERPIGQLCSAPIQVSANGNAGPLLCRGGEVNVLAWRHYADVSNTVLGLGQNPTQGQVEGALCADLRLHHATASIESSGYRLAKAYYLWSFLTDPTQVMYKSPPCSQ